MIKDIGRINDVRGILLRKDALNLGTNMSMTYLYLKINLAHQEYEL